MKSLAREGDNAGVLRELGDDCGDRALSPRSSRGKSMGVDTEILTTARLCRWSDNFGEGRSLARRVVPDACPFRSAVEPNNESRFRCDHR